jgi:hypothetical protein
MAECPISLRCTVKSPVLFEGSTIPIVELRAVHLPDTCEFIGSRVVHTIGVQVIPECSASEDNSTLEYSCSSVRPCPTCTAPLEWSYQMSEECYKIHLEPGTIDMYLTCISIHKDMLPILDLPCFLIDPPFATAYPAFLR